MATKNPAKLLGLSTVLGELAPGRKADVAVVSGDRARPYEAILAATPKEVRLVIVGGKVLYGDAFIRSLGQATPDCDAVDVCGASKFACVAQSGGAAADKLGTASASSTTGSSPNCRSTTTRTSRSGTFRRSRHW